MSFHVSKVFLAAESTISGCFWVECEVMHQIFDSFYFILKKRSKLGQKIFGLILRSFFQYALLCLPSYAPIFYQIKGLMEIHSRGKFYEYSISGSQVINFQMFSWQCNIHEMAPFEGGSGGGGGGRVLGLFTPKYGSILLKISPEVVYCKKKIVCEQSFKIKCLSTNGTYPKFTVLVRFWALFTPGKQKILKKTRIFLESTSLGLSNYTSPKSQINHRILTKIIKKIPFFGPKMGLNCPLGQPKGSTQIFT